jgi:hypothetical protein
VDPGLLALEARRLSRRQLARADALGDASLLVRLAAVDLGGQGGRGGGEDEDGGEDLLEAEACHHGDFLSPGPYGAGPAHPGTRSPGPGCATLDLSSRGR